VKLVVAEEDLEAAAALLTEFASAAVIDDHEPAPLVEPVAIPPKAEVRCPECGSAESIRIRRLLVFSLLALLMYGIGLVADQQELALAGILAAALIAAVLPSRRCAICGTRWPDDEADDEDEIHAPPPDASDLVEVLCPRCSSPEFHRIDYRKLKVLPLMFSASAFVVPLIWPFLAKRECDNCGFRR
jgi:predicted nucleic acid-binding Zn ribbon protein